MEGCKLSVFLLGAPDPQVWIAPETGGVKKNVLTLREDTDSLMEAMTLTDDVSLVHQNPFIQRNLLSIS